MLYTGYMATKTRLSLEEFLAMPGIDEQRLELLDGEVVEKVSSRWGHGRIAFVLARHLDRLGFVSVEPRAVIPETAGRGPSAPIPDVAFYTSAPPARDEWMSRPPDIAIEVLSPGQSRTEMRAKVDVYVSFGVRSVWVVDMERESVDIYEADARTTLSGDMQIRSDVVPGFSLAVGALFAEADRQ